MPGNEREEKKAINRAAVGLAELVATGHHTHASSA
jgi:hypothetical protein